MQYSIILLQMTGGNDISLIYPWVHINCLRQEIGLWLDREEAAMERRTVTEAKRSEEEETRELPLSGRRRLSQGMLQDQDEFWIFCIQPEDTVCIQMRWGYHCLSLLYIIIWEIILFFTLLLNLLSRPINIHLEQSKYI